MGWNLKVIDQKNLGQQTSIGFQKIVNTNSQDRIQSGIYFNNTASVGVQLFLWRWAFVAKYFYFSHLASTLIFGLISPHPGDIVWISTYAEKDIFEPTSKICLASQRTFDFVGTVFSKWFSHKQLRPYLICNAIWMLRALIVLQTCLKIIFCEFICRLYVYNADAKSNQLFYEHRQFCPTF